MTDEELERALGRQRVVGPPSSLRARVLDSATGQPVRVRLGVFDYATAALAAGLVLLASLIDAPVPSTADARRQRETLAVAAALGGGPDALQYAEFVVSRGGELDDPAATESPW
jgi:hypothetical protein